MEKILIAGGTGLIGQEIIKTLSEEQYIVHILSRSEHENSENIKYFHWDTSTMEIDHAALDVDYIINLAGAGIADKRWSDSRKKVIIESRVKTADLIRKGLEESGFRPKLYLSASAIGYYGDSGDQLMDESSKPVDKGFLSTVTVQWEDAALTLKPYVEHGVTIIRIGVVLAKDGGAFPKILLPFKMGMASYFGNGEMYYSWIHVKDVAKIFIHCLKNKLSGTYNAVAPEVVTNKEMVKTIKDVKGGIAILNSVPEFALRIAMGEMADVVLTSNRVSSQKIKESGFKFKYAGLEKALSDLLD